MIINPYSYPPAGGGSAPVVRHSYAADATTDIANVVVDSGSGRLLLVAMVRNTAFGWPTTVSYGGVNMTPFTELTWNGGTNALRVWYYLDPPVGTANVVGWGASVYNWTMASSIDGVDTTSFATAFDTPGTGTGNSTAPSASVPSGAGKLVWGSMASLIQTITVSSPNVDLGVDGEDANEPTFGKLFTNDSGNASETCNGTMTSNEWAVWGVALNPL